MTVQEWLGEDNKLGIDIWNRKYRFKEESFDEWLNRISNDDLELKKCIIDKKFLFGGRTLASRGTGNGLSFSNCYSSGYAPDSVKGMMDLNTNLALTYQSSGGQGLSLSLIRPKGSPVKGGLFKSDGIVPFMELFNQTTASISQGGCIHEDELVLTQEGYKKIKDIKIGDKAWTKKGFIEVNYVFDKGIQPTYEVKTKKGYSIRTTLDHKFAIDGFNTKKLSDLSIGDSINVITKNSTFNKFIPIAYLLGYYMGNGYTNTNENGGSLCMHKNQIEIKDRLIQCIEQIGFSVKVTESENAIRLYLNKEIIDYLKNNGWIKNKAKNIEIPDYIMLSEDDDIKISYLAGALDSDGTIRETGIKYDTISKKYAQQLHTLMSSIGFFPTISIIERDENRSTLFTVSDSIRTNTPYIPSVKIEKYVKPNVTKNSAYSTPYTIKNACLDRHSVKRLQKISKDDYVGLHTYLSSNGKFAPIIFDEIESIVQIENSHVYDISLIEEHLFDCNGIYISNSRKGALMMSLSIWHPEIETFISIKNGTDKISKANLSVEIDDHFMELVDKGITEYKYVNTLFGTENIINPVQIYDKIMERAYIAAEPGVIFTNRFRKYNLMEKHSSYKIVTSNPCGEQPLPANGACNLGSINISAYINNPFTKEASFNFEQFKKDIHIYVKALDDVLEEGKDLHALQEQRDMANNYRNIGLGIMGYATALMMMGMRYGGAEAKYFTGILCAELFNEALISSALLAKERGKFPKYEDNILNTTILKDINPYTKKLITQYGIRNCSLLSIAPSGSIGTMLDISTGLEPYYALSYQRKTESLHGDKNVYYSVEVDVAKKARNTFGDHVCVSALDIDWHDRVKTQGIMQDFIDTAISSTVNVPENITLDELRDLYLFAWKQGLKGITIYRENSFEAILSSNNSKANNIEKSDVVFTQDVPRGEMSKVPADTYYIPKDMNHGCGRSKIMIGFSPSENRVVDVYHIARGEGGCSKNTQGEAILMSQVLRLGGNLEDVKKSFRGIESCMSCVMSKMKGRKVDGINCPNILIDLVIDTQNELKQNDITIEEIVKTIKTDEPAIICKPETNVVVEKIKCPECGAELSPIGGCWTCSSCGFSKCD